MSRKRNPVLEKKFNEGYAKGLEHGIQKGVLFFKHKFDGLKEVEGIGEKTLEKIKSQLGYEYFEE
ncbi:MAG TPA: hypothetical protein VK105_20400 [Virgibacillus sp.]|nr:hypothetical protein [Virgibacillus sp.]HLR69455.1 hypothetical protein [Virgibacillus sp.]